jgi:hypothetical protein
LNYFSPDVFQEWEVKTHLEISNLWVFTLQMRYFTPFENHHLKLAFFRWKAVSNNRANDPEIVPTNNFLIYFHASTFEFEAGYVCAYLRRHTATKRQCSLPCLSAGTASCWRARYPRAFCKYKDDHVTPHAKRHAKELSTTSQSHITTDNQSASPSWCQAPIWDPRPIILSPWDFLLDSYCLLFCSALSDERTGLQFTVAAGPRQRSHARVCPLWREVGSVFCQSFISISL